jgi:hypothetical protein
MTECMLDRVSLVGQLNKSLSSSSLNVSVVIEGKTVCRGGMGLKQGTGIVSPSPRDRCFRGWLTGAGLPAEKNIV